MARKQSETVAGIEIIKTPPSSIANLEIREAWVGRSIPLATDKELVEDPPSGMRAGSENLGGYLVLRTKAINSLREAGEIVAADFWASLPLGRYLEFRRDVCRRVKISPRED